MGEQASGNAGRGVERPCRGRERRIAGRGWGRISRGCLVALALVVLAGVGARCPSQPIIRILTPVDGASAEACSVLVQVHIKGTADPDTLVVELNGDPLSNLEPLSSTLYQTEVRAADLLAGANLLVATVEAVSGGSNSDTVGFDFASDEPRARQITDEADLIQGPLAHGRIGDWLLENCTARFVIQDGGQRDLHSVGQYGGNVIDAELRDRPGRDQFFEFQPALNVETVVNAQTVEIVHDGSDGQPAVVRACGPDDLLDYVNPSTIVADLGFTFPEEADDNKQFITACTEYTLASGRRHLRVETFVMNPHPEELGLYVGDYVNGMGQLEQWTVGTAGVGEIDVTTPPPAIPAQAQGYFGFGKAGGVDYALVPQEFPSQFGTSSFTTSGVTFVAHSHAILTILALGFDPTFLVPAAENGAPGVNSFVRFFGVGDGSPSNAFDLRAEVLGLSVGRIEGCVTQGGAPAPGARVAVGLIPSGTEIRRLSTLFVTGEDGCYGGASTTGTRGVAVSREGTPYVGGGVMPALETVSIVAGQTTVVNFALPDTGRLEVSVVDESGLPIPARVTVVGFDPSPEVLIFSDALSTNDITTGLFRDVTKDPLSFGVTWIQYVGADGTTAFDIEPGTYQVFLSRGTEYSAFDAPVTVVAGATTSVSGQIARVLDTSGFISSDYHVHMLNSPDSRISFENRALSFAGEGVDNIISTDHDARTDLLPTIASLGLTPFVHATVGEEITTFDYGHFNAYPLGVDPTRISGGSTDWAGAAPPGENFPSFGNFVLSPAEIEAAVLNDPVNAGLDPVVQINHITSHFEPLKIDTSLVGGPASLLTDAEKQARRLCSLDISGSCAALGELFHPFPALELWNGASRGAQNTFLGDRMGIWMNLLNQGIPTTAIADTDTHTLNNLEQAGARTWTPSSTNDPASIVDVEIADAVRAGKGVGGQGIYVQARLEATDGSGGVADLSLGGSTLLPVSNGEANLVIEVQAPIWAEYDTIEIYQNATTCIAARNGGVPVLFGALPTWTLTAGASNTGSEFTIQEVNVFPAIPGARRLETQRSVPLTGMAGDAWVVVVVKGRPGVSRPMFPVYPRDLSPATNMTLADLLDGNLGEGGVNALGFTNALYVDTDVPPNGFDAPGVPPPLDPCP
jgi:hypothetical protein